MEKKDFIRCYSTLDCASVVMHRQQSESEDNLPHHCQTQHHMLASLRFSSHKVVRACTKRSFVATDSSKKQTRFLRPSPASSVVAAYCSNTARPFSESNSFVS